MLYVHISIDQSSATYQRTVNQKKGAKFGGNRTRMSLEYREMNISSSDRMKNNLHEDENLNCKESLKIRELIEEPITKVVHREGL
ncbi:hypothetical protein T05_2792 [Trichinella murrelli]|uniref:Uncharacterized protein n=1 Tax=Trichinella murrelli TaxID=144512 RepID=A0A0V0TGQ6_9BILA|nr:hypothetical protein T05_2792 [Trichinella murrelli]